MSKPITLPPLRMTLLNDVPEGGKVSKDNSCEQKIQWALRYQHDFEQRRASLVENYTVKVYRSLAKTPSLAKGFGEEESDEEEVQQSPEYLTFLYNPSQGREVYVLATSRAFKAIRPYCSPQFPERCFDHYASNISHIDKVSFRQIFSSVSESTLTLKGALKDKVDQETQAYRHCRAVLRILPGIAGSDIKVEFSERSVLIYRDLTLRQYAQFLQPISLAILKNPTLNYGGLPMNRFSAVQDKTKLSELNHITSSYISGYQYHNPTGWKFNLELSDKWCSSGYRFRLHWFGHQDAYPFTDTEQDRPLTLMDVCQLMSGPCLPDQLLDGLLALEYKTISNQWYTMPLLDCIEGSVTNPTGELFFKIDRGWYQIESNYLADLNRSFTRVLALPALVLKQGEKGHLFYSWDQVTDENTYNGIYAKQHPGKWYDGNLKRHYNLELCDLLQIDGDDVFIYHVKQHFNTSMKVAGAQLLSSAQVIQSCRVRSANHTDLAQLQGYCERVGGSSAQFLQNALLKRKLHFVLAFRMMGEPIQEMIQSGSLSAKHEIIKAHEAITSLNINFHFHISPIQAASSETVFIPQSGSYVITHVNHKHCVNGFSAEWNGQFYQWSDQNGLFAINPSGPLLFWYSPSQASWVKVGSSSS